MIIEAVITGALLIGIAKESGRAYTLKTKLERLEKQVKFKQGQIDLLLVMKAQAHKNNRKQ